MYIKSFLLRFLEFAEQTQKMCSQIVNLAFISKVSLIYFLLLIISEGVNSHPPNPSTAVRKGPSGRCLGGFFDMFKANIAETFKSNATSNPDDVTFFLHPDPRNPNSTDELVFQDVSSLVKARFRYGQPFKFLIHGFTQSRFGYYPTIVKNSYLKRTREHPEEGGYNVIAVDWEPLARSFLQQFNLRDYEYSVKNVIIAGARLAEFIIFLQRNNVISSFDQVHIIGFSLGAHVGGSAGKQFTKLTNLKFGRITGLDPAGPGYNEEYFTEKLQNNCAKFLDVYHTSMGLYGMWDNVGDAEFFPNGGGPVQPDCVNIFRNNKLMGLCSHSMAPYFYAQSITEPYRNFIAKGCDGFINYQRDKCNGTTLYGEYCHPKTRGVYYISLDGSAAPHINDETLMYF